MSKQTFTTGQILTAAQMTTLQANDYNQTVSAKVASYTLVATDAGTRITMSNAAATTITVNTSLFTAGDTLTITNIGAGVCTITAGTATVSTAGSLALAQYDSGTLYFTSTGVSIWNGANPGDITGVTAGTGISGGGTSGTVTVTNSMATEITAKGDLIAGTGSATFDNLAVGTNGQTLVADSTASTGLKWATPSSGGKLLQVVSATTSTSYTNSTTTLTDVTGLTATITPTLNTSKILVMISASCSVSCSASIVYVGGKLLRGATPLVDWDGYKIMSAFTPGAGSQISIQYYDSPATTSATTYKMQARIDQAINSQSTVWNYATSPSVITLFEIGV
jgi:hypothetical protein